MKKIIAFDLDDTLAVSKSAISPRMKVLLEELLVKYDVCVISGGKYEQFEKQVVNHLEVNDKSLSRLHLMPTCGTRYYRYQDGEWKPVYIEDLSNKQKEDAINALEVSAKKLGFWSEKVYGDIIEDRGSQITFSAIGQKAPAEEKYKWDPTNEKKLKLRDEVAKLLPDLEVRTGGTTSIDITRAGIDKAYGMKKLMTEANVSMNEILFIGDNLQVGGNDYPVKEMGIDSIAVEGWEEAACVIEGILGVS